MVESIMEYYIQHEPTPPWPVYDPGPSIWHLFSTTSYEKGASVLHMLRHIIGDSVFFEFVNTYGATFAHGAAITQELWDLAETVSGQELDWFFEEWLMLPGHPEYDVTWGYDSLGPDSFRIDMIVEQVQGHLYNVPTYVMPVDIRVETGSRDIDFVVWDSLDYQEFAFYVDERPTNLEFDPDDWILRELSVAQVEEDGPGLSRPLALSFSVSPTLVRGTASCRYSLPAESKVDLTLFDPAGRAVRTLFSGRMSAGSHDLELNLRDVGSGLYFLVLETRDEIRRERVLVLN
jgi:hypothetical protein